MTFSIIARCPKRGRLGLGIATFSIAAGGRCEGIRHGVGICKTQAYINRGNDLLALELLEQGLGPAARHEDRWKPTIPTTPIARSRSSIARATAARIPAAARGHGPAITSATASWPSATCWPARR